MKHRAISLLLAAGLTVFLSLITVAGLRAETIVRVGIHDSEPLSKIDSSAGAGGFMVDILKHIARKEKWRFEFVPGTLKENLHNLNAGRIDILVAVPFSETSARYYDFTQVTVISTWAQIYYASDQPTPQSLLDLRNMNIGLVKDDFYSQELRDVVRRLSIPCKFVEFNNNGELFHAIQNKWVDAGAADRFYGILHRKKYSVSGSPIIFSPVEFRYATAKNRHPELLQNLNYHISNLKNNPDSIYYQMADQIAGTSRDTRLYARLFWVVVVAISFLCILALMILAMRIQIRKKTRQLVLKNDELASENSRRREAELAFRESEELYRTLADRSFANVYVVQNGRFCFANSNTAKTFGRPAEEILGQRALAFVHEEDREQVKLCSREMLAGQRSSPYEYRLIRQAGEPCWMLETVTAIQYDGRPAVLGTAMDISEQKKAEEEKKKLETQLQQAQKMEAIGTLAGGIAHDFNNILAAVIGYTEMAFLTMNKNSPEYRYLDKVLTASDRARELIKQILTFSRNNEKKLQPVNVVPIIKETIKLLRASLPTTIEIQLQIDAVYDRVVADATQMHQVLMNLCTNAAHAMKGKSGRLTIGLTNRLGPDHQTPAALCNAPLLVDPYLELTVADTGCGISPSILDRIFDPFFTTKEVGKGTGLGLSVVHGIVKSYGGRISVDSEVGRGSTFRVCLPLAMQKQDATILPADRRSLLRGDERILLVDDEETLVEMGRAMLEGLGYRVTTATGSQQALARFAEQPDRFDLIMTDMTMPQMTGLDLSRRLLGIRADIPVILCTGYSEELQPETLRDAGVRECLLKPFTYVGVASLVRRILDEGKNFTMVA